MHKNDLTAKNTIQNLPLTLKQTSFDEKLLLSHFPLLLLSIYTCPIAAISAVSILFFTKRLTPVLHTIPNINFLYAWFAFTSITAIVYGNWPGLAIGVLFFCVVLIGLYFWTVMTPTLLAKIKHMLVGFSYLAFIVALLQKIGGMERPVAFFYNPTYYGYICVLIVIVCINRYLVSGNPFRLRSAQNIPIIVNIAGIALSQCRTAWVALFAGTIVLLLVHKKQKALLACVIFMLIFAVGILAFPDLLPRMDKLSESVAIRQMIWQTSWQAFLEHPLSGQGFLTYSFYTIDIPALHYSNGYGGQLIAHAHNIFLDTLINFGLIGSFLFLNFLLPFLANWIQKVKYYPQLSIAVACFCAMMIHGLLDLPMLGPQSGIITVMLLASSGVLNLYPVSVLNEPQQRKAYLPLVAGKTLQPQKSVQQTPKR